MGTVVADSGADQLSGLPERLLVGGRRTNEEQTSQTATGIHRHADGDHDSDHRGRIDFRGYGDQNGAR